MRAGHADKKIIQLACYISDGTLQSYKLNTNGYLPSQLAAAAVFIARQTIGRTTSWSPTLSHYSGYTEEEVAPVARAVLKEKASASSELGSVDKKYSKACFGRVAYAVFVCDF